MLSAILILAAIVVGCSVFFRVDEVRVLGEERYTKEQIAAAAGVKDGESLLLVNKFRIAPRLISTLPYLESVSIYRDLPDTLVIEVRECTAVASIPAGEATWLISARGKLLERSTVPVSAYPAVEGLVPQAPVEGTAMQVAEEDALRWKSLLQVFSALAERGMLGGVQGFDMSAPNAIQVKYLNRFTIRMPASGSDYAYLLRAADTAIRTKLGATDSGVLDMTDAEEKGEFRLIPYAREKG